MDKYTDTYYTQEAETSASADSMEIELRKTIQRQKKTLFRLMEKINRLRIVCVILLVLLVIESFLWWGDSSNNTVIPETASTTTSENTDITINIPEEKQEPETVAKSFVHNVDEARIDSIISGMTLEQKVYQMIFTTPENLTGVPAVTVTGDTSKAAVEKFPVGGIIYSGKNIENKQQVSEMLSALKNFTKLGTFFAIEETGNDFVMTNPEVVTQGANLSFATSADVASSYASIGSELLSLGFNVNLAPYAEATDKSSDYFGADVQTTSDMVKSSVDAMSKANLASAVRYFPSSENSTKLYSDMKNAEFMSFKAGIDAGADFVFVSGKISGEGESYSLSSDYMTKALKTELAFDGVVVADDITSADISGRYTQEQAAVKAINAGADMLVCPIGVANTVNAVLASIESGEISEKTINDSVKRILRVKLFRGIQK